MGIYVSNNRITRHRNLFNTMETNEGNSGNKGKQELKTGSKNMETIKTE